jgi:hypothetical protein
MQLGGTFGRNSDLDRNMMRFGEYIPGSVVSPCPLGYHQSRLSLEAANNCKAVGQ